MRGYVLGDCVSAGGLRHQGASQRQNDSHKAVQMSHTHTHTTTHSNTKNTKESILQKVFYIQFPFPQRTWWLIVNVDKSIKL